MSSKVGVQQGDPISPLFFRLVLHIFAPATAADEGCSSLLIYAWYQDDTRALSIIQERGPTLGLLINAAKCEWFSLSDLSMLPSMMKRSNVPLQVIWKTNY